MHLDDDGQIANEHRKSDTVECQSKPGASTAAPSTSESQAKPVYCASAIVRWLYERSAESSSQSARLRRDLVTTAVWRCEPRSHGRRKAATPLPGRTPSSAVPHRSASPALCPCGHAASFRRRASSFVGRPVCKPPERGARVPVCKAARGGHRQVRVRGWPARLQAPRRSGGTGARVQGRSRWPQAGPGLCTASAAAARAMARCVRCTSGRSASAACSRARRACRAVKRQQAAER